MEVLRGTMLTTTRNERTDNYSPTGNPHLARKISTERHYVGAVDRRISRYNRVKPVGTALGRRDNVHAKCGPKPAGIGQQKEA
ncbi:unnamed protein product [Echinostoma caproni]|uniref:Transposase n=1 Tax=Echinostoma caproni TaxID=27848 RepID=A0A183A6Q2_9TREM|nr:unnamed protein product [Echinostoma caproni]